MYIYIYIFITIIFIIHLYITVYAVYNVYIYACMTQAPALTPGGLPMRSAAPSVCVFGGSSLISLG